MDTIQPESKLRRSAAWSDRDLLPLTELAMACTQCRSEQDFHELVRTRVQPLLVHRGLIAALGYVEQGEVRISKLIGIEIPPECLVRVSQQTQIEERPVLLSWLQRLEPLVMELPRDARLMSMAGIREVKDFDLGRMAMHGVMDVAAHRSSYFCFTQAEAGLSDQQVSDRLKLIVPLLHAAFVKFRFHGDEAIRKRLPHPLMALSPAEHELLAWMSRGMGEDEIARVQGKRLSAVRSQLDRLYGKLGVEGPEGALRLHRLELPDAAQARAGSRPN